MKRALVGAITALVLSIGSASAADDDDQEAFSDTPLPGVAVPSRSASEAMNPMSHGGSTATRGAKALGLPAEYVAGVDEGLSLLYRRQYKETRKHFEALDGRFPGTGIAAVADVLVWQALMLENFDFRYDAQYKAAHKVARAELEAALARPGGEGWEHFLMGGILGIEAIHMIRQSQYVPALQRAFDAMDHIQAAEEAAPEFVDLELAEGLYDYWRTVITNSSKMLPDYGDHRAEGIAKMQHVEKVGIILAKPATFTMVFTWLEERKLDNALRATLTNHAAYPENVINTMLAGQTYTWLKKYDDAMKMYDEVLANAPDNNRVRYYRGITLMRMGKPDEAKAELERYLRSDHLEPWQKASSHYRLGQLAFRAKDYTAAEEAYRSAIKETGHKASKAALDRIKKMQRDGRIPS